MKQPNLVYVFADQLRADVLGYAGDKRAHTPNIDRFASQSMDFKNAVSVYPVCAPYRASLFTGKYPSSTGMVINEIRCMPDPDAIGHVLTNGGYQTGYIGKWHLYNHSTDHSDMSNHYVPPGPYRLGFDGVWASYGFNHSYKKGFYFKDDFVRHDIEGYEPDTQTDLAVEYLESVDREKPFAMFLSYGTPHDPWTWDNAPDDYADMFREVQFDDPPNFTGEASADVFWAARFTKEWVKENWIPNRNSFKQVYYSMVANLDANFGKLMAALDRLGLAEDTIVVFTSDHGEMWGAHERIAKKIFYEEAARVPFLMRWPARIAAASQTDLCLNTPDIMPTLLDLLQLPIPASVEGQSVARRILGEAGPEPEAAFLQGMGHTFQWGDGDEWRALRDKQYTYARFIDGKEYLYDHQRDPFQLTNLAAEPDFAGLMDKYRSMLNDKMAKLNDEIHPCTWYNDRWVVDRIVVRSATRELS
jgi:arylsulfatase A-like enzyme